MVLYPAFQARNHDTLTLGTSTRLDALMPSGLPMYVLETTIGEVGRYELLDLHPRRRTIQECRSTGKGVYGS